MKPPSALGTGGTELARSLPLGLAGAHYFCGNGEDGAPLLPPLESQYALEP